MSMRQRKRQRRRFVIPICIVSFLLLIGIGVIYHKEVAAALFRTFVAPKINQELAETYVPNNEGPPPPEKINHHDPFTFLLLGIDQRNKEVARSDTMIFGLFTPSKNEVTLISIPRDSYTYLPNEDAYDKASHAFAYGGASSAVKLVEYLFNQPIDYYMTINFKGVIELVDGIGGIELNIEEDLVNDDPMHEHFVVKANQDVYQGVDALNFLRFREDAGGDISRASRNQEFIAAFLKKARSIKNITKLHELLDIVSENLQTNLPPSQMTEYMAEFIEDSEIQFSTVTLNGESTRMGPNNLFYIKLDERQIEEIKTQLQLKLNH